MPTPSKLCGKCGKAITTKIDPCKKCQKIYHKTCAKNMKGDCDVCCLGSALDSPPAGLSAAKTGVFIDLDPKSLTIETLLEQLNKKMQVVFEIKEDTGFYAEKYDDMIKKQNEMLDVIKNQQNKIDSLSNKCKHLEVLNSALEQRVHTLEQTDRSKNIEISGLNMKNSEKLPCLMEKIAGALGAPLVDVEKAWRAGRPIPGRRPPNLIVRLRSESARDLWLGKKNLLRSSKQIYPEDADDNSVYLNEDLTKYNRELLWNAKQKMKNTFKFIWVKGGKVLCKREENARTKHIMTLADIDKCLLEVAA